MDSTQPTETVDAVVIGAGITGIYLVWQMKQLALSVRGVEAGEDVGGTWFWNRYPGCRLDTESYAYGYFSLAGIIPEWNWSERFAGQPELLRYVNYAADHMGIREDYRFNTRVRAAEWDEGAGLWHVTNDDGSRIDARFLLSAVGPLSATRMPDIPGIDSFQGTSFHTSRWPRGADGGPAIRDFTGLRVGVIGTGATGVQLTPIVAETAARLHVFQRTPNWCTPLGNHPLTPQRMAELRGDRQEFLDFIKTTETAFPYQRYPLKATEATPEERNALFDSLYAMPGYGIWLSGYRDLLTNRQSNAWLGDFIADKIRQRVIDKDVAERLVPRNHAFGTRRVPMETGYYETFNRPNVEFVDISETGISRIGPTGLTAAGRDFDLDVIIYATGFDGVTGALDRIDIRGTGGQSLREAWRDGPETWLGLQTVGFPNFFTLVGAHNGAAFCNIGVCGALQVEWVAGLIGHMQTHGLTRAEPLAEHQADWTQHVYDTYAKTLLSESDHWWVRKTPMPDGTVQKRALIYVGGAPQYRELCRSVAEAGYYGFDLR